MPMDYSQLGMQAAEGAISAGLGMALGNYNDKRQLKQQGKLQELQLKGNKQMLDWQAEKELAMWKNTSYGAQKEQMIKAGLNPALMYGMGGGGGSTTGSGGGGVSSGNAPTGGREVQDMAAMGMERQSQMAQIELMKAQARNLNVDSDNKQTGGVGNENVKANTANVQQQTTNAVQELENLKQMQDNLRWDYEIKRVEVALKRLEEYQTGAVMDNIVEKVNVELKEAIEGLQAAKRNNRIEDATEQTMIQKTVQEGIGTYLDNELRRLQIKMQPYELQKLRTEISNMFQENMRGWDKLSIESRKLMIEQLKSSGIEEEQAEKIVSGLAGIVIGSGVLKSGKTMPPAQNPNRYQWSPKSNH